MNTAETLSTTDYKAQALLLLDQLHQRDKELHQRDEELQNQNKKIAELNEQLNWFKRQIFGKRSERIVNTTCEYQLTLFDLDGFIGTQGDEEEPKKEDSQVIPEHTRKKPNRNGQDKLSFPDDLPVKTTILDISEEEKICPVTGLPLVKIGEEISRKLAHEPGSYYIKEIIRPKYANPAMEEVGILTAALPDSFIPKCRADESLLADIVTRKFGDHLPLYRISEIMSREDINISRKLLSQWIIRCAAGLKPIYDLMLKKVLEGNNIFIDESPVKLQDIGKCKQGYMWTVVGGGGSDPPYRVYEFKADRCHKNVLDLLKDYRGGLHSDKYAAYQRLAENKVITWYPCWSHIRRKFFEAEQGDQQLRAWVLRKIRYLFMLERVAWNRSPEERLTIRLEKEVPIIDELISKIKERLIDGNILPKSKLREAIGYFCGLIPYLKNYTLDPFARLDNNIAERALRPLAIGRKNWLFFGSTDGALAGGILLSLVQTCRGLEINPRDYLEDVMRRIMGHSNQKLDELLPDNWLKARESSSKSK